MTQTTETIETFDTLTETYALCREELADSLRNLEDELQAVRRNYLQQIKDHAATTQQAKSDLENAIETAPAMFVKPRSFVLHGIKIGFKKSKGKIEPGKNAVELIRKHLADRFDVLVETKEEPIKPALADLTAGERQLIGCKLVGAGDLPFVKATGDNIEKLVDKILEDAGSVED